MKYQVIIYRVDVLKSDRVMVENVLQYKHEGSAVFYVAGTDFEQWFVLLPGQSVQVTEQDDDQ